jgi:hypothetical protein
MRSLMISAPLHPTSGYSVTPATVTRFSKPPKMFPTFLPPRADTMWVSGVDPVRIAKAGKPNVDTESSIGPDPGPRYIPAELVSGRRTTKPIRTVRRLTGRGRVGGLGGQIRSGAGFQGGHKLLVNRRRLGAEGLIHLGGHCHVAGCR